MRMTENSVSAAGQTAGVVNETDATALETQMRDMGARARAAARVLADASPETKRAALMAAAGEVRAAAPEILAANAEDMRRAKAGDRPASFLDRLALDDARIESIAAGTEAVAGQDDPVGAVMESWERPNGLNISRVRTPLGVIGVIFEARPNVAADAAALCVKAGNAAILRCGSDSLASSLAINAAFRRGLKSAGLPEDAAQMVDTPDRAAVAEMLKGLSGAIDVIVPRGGKSLVGRVQDEARVPVFSHLEGLCHVYIDASAKAETAQAIVLNAKMRRTGICGAAETVLVDAAAADALVPLLTQTLVDGGCAVRGDAASCARDARITAASEEDWRTEYLAPVISMAVVDGVGGAIDHIAQYGSNHTDSIVCEDAPTAERFPARSGQRHCHAQRLDSIRRWRRIRHGRGNRHRHRQNACARPGRGRAADDVQICRTRSRPDPGLTT